MFIMAATGFTPSILKWMGNNPELAFIIITVGVLGGTLLACLVAGPAGLVPGTKLATIGYGALGAAIGGVVAGVVITGFSLWGPGVDDLVDHELNQGDKSVEYIIDIKRNKDVYTINVARGEFSNPELSCSGSEVDEVMMNDIVPELAAIKDNKVKCTLKTSNVPESLQESIEERLHSSGNIMLSIEN